VCVCVCVCVCVYVRVRFNGVHNLQFMRPMLADLFAFWNLLFSKKNKLAVSEKCKPVVCKPNCLSIYLNTFYSVLKEQCYQP